MGSTIYDNKLYSNSDYEVLAPGQSKIIYNPSTYQSVFRHTKWRETMTNRSTGKKEGVLTFMANLPKPTARFLAQIDESRSRGSNVGDVGSATSKTETKNRSIAFKQLRELEILKRAGRNKFMISPKFLIPNGPSIIEQVHLWNSLQPTDEIITAPPIRKKNKVLS